MVEFGFIDLDGKVTHVRTIPQASIAACPHYIMAPEHYRDDNTCRCDDPTHTEMKEWGYNWREEAWR
jgi:hypothetical protein